MNSSALCEGNQLAVCFLLNLGAQKMLLIVSPRIMYPDATISIWLWYSKIMRLNSAMLLIVSTILLFPDALCDGSKQCLLFYPLCTVLKKLTNVWFWLYFSESLTTRSHGLLLWFYVCLSCKCFARLTVCCFGDENSHVRCSSRGGWWYDRVGYR